MRVPTTGKRLYSALMFVLVSVIGGALTAGLFVPTIGITTEVTKSLAIALNSLPEELKVLPPSEGSKVLLANGELLSTFYDQNRKNVKLDDISPIMRKAMIGAEDHRFYEHGPLDLRGTLRAFIRSANGTAQGGSTMTQQYVKLALLYDATARKDAQDIESANSRTVSRKILELRYAIGLEKQLSKDQILELYLNTAYFGDRAYGIESAAQHYFGIPAKQLNLAQSAMLAGLVRNPVTTDPVHYPALATERRNQLLDRLVEINFIKKAESDEAKKTVFDKSKVVPNPPRGCSGARYPHLCDYVYQTLTKQTPSLGATPEDRANTLNRNGLIIQTSIDPRFQDAAQEAVSSVVAPSDPVNAMMNMVQPGSGLILAMAQSKRVMGTNTAAGETFLNYSAPDNMNGSGGSEGGSTFKAYTVVAALLAGMNPVTERINSPGSLTLPRGAKFESCTGTILVGPKPWTVTTGGTGNLNMYDGTTKSSNTFFVQLEQKVGICNTVKAAEALGLKRADGANLQTGILPNGKRIPDPNDIDGQKMTFTLGNTPATPISMAASYATLAARGMRCDPIIVKEVKDEKNRTYPVPSANCEQTIPQEVADRANDILHGPFSGGGTASSATISGYQVSGKTGTQTKTPTILTNGYTPDLSGSAIITSDAKHPEAVRAAARSGRAGMKAPIPGLTVHGTRFPGGYTLSGHSGREAGSMIWKPAMAAVLPLLPKTPFVSPPRIHDTYVPPPETTQETTDDPADQPPTSVPAPAPAPQVTPNRPKPKPQKPTPRRT